MPLPMVHLAVAVKVKNKLEIADESAFYLGAIAPDISKFPCGKLALLESFIEAQMRVKSTNVENRKTKNPYRPQSVGIFRGTAIQIHWRPHPYQVTPEDFWAYFLAFPALLSREKMVLGGLVSDKFFRFSSRVGQVVGQGLSCG